jgi:hypothetical protein
MSNKFEIVEPKIIDGNETMVGVYNGGVQVDNGSLQLQGTVNGSLRLAAGTSAIILGNHNGSVRVAAGARLEILGIQSGSTHVDSGGFVTVMPSGRMGGSLHNQGIVEVHGRFGGSMSGGGDFTLEGNGSIKDPDRYINGSPVYIWNE